MSGKGYIDYNHTDLAIRKMKERFRNGHALDFQELVSRFTLDSATEFLFGNCVHSLMMDLPYAYNDPPSPEIAQTAAGATAKFSQAFTGVQEALAVRLRIGWSWIFSEVFKDTTRKHMEVVSAYIQPIVEEALRKKRSAAGKAGSDKTTEDEETLLDHLVKQTEGGFAGFPRAKALLDGVHCRPGDPPRRDAQHHDRGSRHGKPHAESAQKSFVTNVCGRLLQP